MRAIDVRQDEMSLVLRMEILKGNKVDTREREKEKEKRKSKADIRYSRGIGYTERERELREEREAEATTVKRGEVSFIDLRQQRRK